MALWLLSAYERKMGTKRYFMVFVASGLFPQWDPILFLPLTRFIWGLPAAFVGLSRLILQILRIYLSKNG